MGAFTFTRLEDGAQDPRKGMGNHVWITDTGKPGDALPETEEQPHGRPGFDADGNIMLRPSPRIVAASTRWTSPMTPSPRRTASPPRSPSGTVLASEHGKGAWLIDVQAHTVDAPQPGVDGVGPRARPSRVWAPGWGPPSRDMGG